MVYKPTSYWTHQLSVLTHHYGAPSCGDIVKIGMVKMEVKIPGNIQTNMEVSMQNNHGNFQAFMYSRLCDQKKTPSIYFNHFQSAFQCKRPHEFSHFPHCWSPLLVVSIRTAHAQLPPVSAAHAHETTVQFTRQDLNSWELGFTYHLYGDL